MELKDNERIDDLQYKDLKIIQNKKGFCFGIDAVLLSDFAKKMRKDSVAVDMCSGTGIIAILLSGKTDVKKFYSVEIQTEVAEMSKRSVELNGLEDRITIINDDINKVKDKIKSGTIDYITVNPPYKAKGSGLINEKDTKTISRHEISCTLEDIVREASRMLKEKR
jgi:tRNA1Val (adenine37-N6)-methyltransferase